MKTFNSKSPGQTRKIAAEFIKKVRGGTLLALFGDLGSGKTEFVKGLARALKIKKTVVSPTFLFLKSYRFRKNGESWHLHHFDLYRLRGPQDAKSLGLEELISQERRIIVIEWPEKIKPLLPKKRINIFFTHGRVAQQRTIKFSS